MAQSQLRPCAQKPELSVGMLKLYCLMMSYPRGFDGSSTNQASGGDSDLMLQPVRVVRDPIRGSNILVLCEVTCQQPHETNHRCSSRCTDRGVERENAWFGFEQEHTLFSDQTPLGWPSNGYPAQGLSIVQLSIGCVRPNGLSAPHGCLF